MDLARKQAVLKRKELEKMRKEESRFGVSRGSFESYTNAPTSSIGRSVYTEPVVETRKYAKPLFVLIPS